MNIIAALQSFFALAATSKWVVWPLMPSLLIGLVVLAVEREILFQDNLFDLETHYENVDCGPETLTARTIDGTCNDLDNPAWGSVGIRFGRNIDPDTLPAYVSDEEILEPNPRKISREFMTRDEFIPVEQLNLLATGWIQFMVHDWFDHGDNEWRNQIRVPIEKDDPDFHGKVMKVKRTKRDSSYDPNVDKVVTYRNEVTHWWDGSQVYGSDADTLKRLRTFQGGKLIMRGEQLPKTWSGKVRTGFNKNWWLGLNLLHNIFAREHNRIADMLAEQYPEMNDQELFDKARLINAALMAKIHTVEWTPAILANPFLEAGMHSNWYGLGEGEFSAVLASLPPGTAEALTHLFGSSQLLDLNKMGAKAVYGMVGGPTDHYGVPYTLTEEFVSVYRMHPLLPDQITLKSLETGNDLRSLTLDDTRERRSAHLIRKYGMENALYSFGVAHPGALTLNNFPKDLQKLRIPFTGPFDLAAVDIIRDRERGIPRYNKFRASIRLKPLDDFEDLFKQFNHSTIAPEHQAIADRLREAYGTIDRMDLMVGLMAENIRPAGFGFGETAFQIFTLMASRRLLSDRFLTVDYKPEVYTQEGYNWVQTRTMRDILVDHFPKLAAEGLVPVNAFKPWGQN